MEISQQARRLCEDLQADAKYYICVFHTAILHNLASSVRSAEAGCARRHLSFSIWKQNELCSFGSHISCSCCCCWPMCHVAALLGHAPCFKKSQFLIWACEEQSGCQSHLWPLATQKEVTKEKEAGCCHCLHSLRCIPIPMGRYCTAASDAKPRNLRLHLAPLLSGRCWSCPSVMLIYGRAQNPVLTCGKAMALPASMVQKAPWTTSCRGSGISWGV